MKRETTIEMSRLMALFAALLMLSQLPAHAFKLISDSTFAPSDWDVASASETGGATNSVYQDTGVGNPSPCRRMYHYLPLVPDTTNSVNIVHRYIGDSYDPSVDGPIHHINFTLDTIRFSSVGGNLVGSNFRMWQGGAGYYYPLPNFSSTSWVTEEHLNLADTDFTNGATSPDFSSTNQVFRFGYGRSNTRTGQGGDFIVDHGIDNFAVAIYSVNDNDLSVTKTSSSSTIPTSSNLTYTITVDNIGAVTATGVTVTDALPSSVTFVSATPDQGSCTNIEGEVICDLESINAATNVTISVVVTTTVSGAITNTVSVSSNEADVLPSNNTDTNITTVVAEGDDLTIDVDIDPITCANSSKGTVCTIDGTVSLANNGVEYGSADVTVTVTDKTKPGKPPKWKFAFQINGATFNLGANPSARINVYLSDDAVLDVNDVALIKPGKEPSTTFLNALAAFLSKPIKVKTSIPKSTSLSGKYLIAVIDFDNQVPESNENNNSAVFGPIP